MSMNKNKATKQKDKKVPAGGKSYQPDRPIKAHSDDRFGRWSFSERIAETIGKSKDPSGLVIGIYGEWGDGKSSVLNMMDEALKKFSNVILVRFNPWYFRSEAKLIEGFFSVLAGELKKSLPTKKEQIGKALKVIGSIASLASGSVGGVINIDPGQGISKLGEKLTETDLEKLRARIEDIIHSSKKRVVVLIDDIDRLDKEEIQAIFKLVKLSANFEYVTYVLAFDDEMVATALSEKYGGVKSGKKFIEKIIQVPLNLPAADPISLRKFTFEGVEVALALSNIELTEEEIQTFVNEYVHGIEPRVRTPRQAKRYANALSFALPILKSEVNSVDQMLIEGLRIFYPALYSMMRENPDIFIGRALLTRDELKKRRLELLKNGLENAGLTAKEKDGVKRLMTHLFPGFEEHGSYGSSWDVTWNKEKRACSEHYFQRFFNYSVPPGDISDKTLDSFLLDLEGRSDDDTAQAFLKLTKSPEEIVRLVEKLRFRESLIPESAIRKFVLAVAKNGAIFPEKNDMFFSTINQAAFLLTGLLARVGKIKDRESLAKDIVLKAEPITFAIECFRLLRHSKDEKPEDIKLSPAVEKTIGQSLAKRIKDFSSSGLIYKNFPNHTHQALWIWAEYGKKSSLESYLKTRFSKYPAEVPELLSTLTPTAYGGGKAAPHKSDFRNDSYKSVAEFISPKIIYKHLKKVYGKKLNGSKYHFSDDIAVNHRISNQFAFLYERESKGITNDQNEQTIIP